MRLLAIVPSVYDRNPSQRYRIEQWEPLLRLSGVEITYRPFESAELNAFLSESRPRRLVKDAVNGLLRLSRLGDSLKIRAERRG